MKNSSILISKLPVWETIQKYLQITRGRCASFKKFSVKRVKYAV